MGKYNATIINNNFNFVSNLGISPNIKFHAAYFKCIEDSKFPNYYFSYKLNAYY